MRVVREVEARRVPSAPRGVDPERTDLPIAGNRAHQEENHDQPGGEQPESEPAPPATVLFLRDWRCRDQHRFHHGADYRQGEHGFRRRTDRRQGKYRFRRGEHRFRGRADGRFGKHGLRRRRWSSGDGILYGRLCLARLGFDRRSRRGRGGTRRQLLQLCPGGADRRRCRRGNGAVLNGGRRQTRKPRLQACPVRRILWLARTPRWEAHLRPTLTPPDYDPYFARGRSAMPL